MALSDWVLIGTTLFLGIVAIWGNQARQWLARPRIKTSFLELHPYCLKTYYRSDPRRPKPINEPVFFFRFKVENDGATTLKSCQAVLEQLWLYNSAGKPERVSEFIDVVLKWANGRRLFTDIKQDPVRMFTDLAPHRRDYLNIGHVASSRYQSKQEAPMFIDIAGKKVKTLRFLFELVETPFSQPNCLAPGKYAVKIVLYADNANPKELWFEIAWSGKWQDTEKEMFRELVINEIPAIERNTS